MGFRSCYGPPNVVARSRGGSGVNSVEIRGMGSSDHAELDDPLRVSLYKVQDNLQGSSEL
jgi:hypothetical protein